MNASVRTAEYFYTRIKELPKLAYHLLTQLAQEDVNLLAFSAVPFGPNHIEFTLFPENSTNLSRVAESFGWTLTGPQHAFLVQGDDHLGAIAALHQKLADASVDVYASSGVTDGRGRYGYVIYVKEGDFKAAQEALKVDLRPNE